MAGSTTGDAVSAANVKRKAKQLQPLPAVEALAGKLPFNVEAKPKVGRQAVAKVDLPAGSLVMLEDALCTTARTRVALHVCHRCFVPIPPPPNPKKGVKALGAPTSEESAETAVAAAGEKAEGDEKQAHEQEGAEQEVAKQEGEGREEEEEEDEEVHPSHNPCLPRYCGACAGKNAELDARLAPVRSRLLSLCKKHSLEPELLQLLLLLDVQHAQRAEGAARTAQDVPAAAWVPEGAAAPPALRCSAADLALAPSLWDRKGEAWRKTVMSATRALHQELVALAESGAVPGYSPSSLPQLRAMAGAIGLCLQGVGPEGSSAEPGLGLFPALTVFPHSCIPNCSYMVSGQTLRVRTLVDVPADTPLTVAYVGLYEPRAARADALRAQRGLPGCSCPRCIQPLEQSTDRFLEGVWCMCCRVNVLVQLPPSDKWEAEFAAQEEREATAEAGVVAAAASKSATISAAKKGGRRGRKAGEPAGAAAAQASVAEGKQPEAIVAAAAAAGEEGGKQQQQAAAAEGEPAEGQAVAAAATGEQQDGEGENQGAKPGEAAAEAEAEALRLWRCCGCGHLQRARSAGGLPGPLDLDEQAANIFSNGMLMVQMKAYQQAESLLTYVRSGIGGRLHPYNIHCLDTLEPLLSIQMRKGDVLGAFNSALQLWESQRLLLDLPSHSQLRYLNAIEDAARHKAANACSAVVKKQFDRKAKAAQTEIAYLRRVLYGEQ